MPVRGNNSLTRSVVLPEIIPNYHPIFVHFTVALIVVAFGSLLLGHLFKSKQRLHNELLIVSRWCLWICALATIFTVAAGFHAYYTVAHDAVSHKVMTTHRDWGVASFILIWITVIWSSILHIKRQPPRWLFTTLLTVATTVVIITGWYGAELVFRHGAGVISLPQVEVAGHQQQINRPKPREIALDTHADHAH